MLKQQALLGVSPVPLAEHTRGRRWAVTRNSRLLLHGAYHVAKLGIDA